VRSEEEIDDGFLIAVGINLAGKSSDLEQKKTKGTKRGEFSGVPRLFVHFVVSL
jgi:hypothetical protein